MSGGNLLNELGLSAGVDWRLLFRCTLAFVPYFITVAYLFSGYYISIEIRHDPNSIFHFFKGILYLLGVEVAEL